MVNNSTNINKMNNHLSPKESLNCDAQQFYQYQQNEQSPLTKRKLKQWWSTILLTSTKQTITSHLEKVKTVMVNNSTNINKMNNHLSPKESLNCDGQQSHQYHQNEQWPLTWRKIKLWWSTILPISTKWTITSHLKKD